MPQFKVVAINGRADIVETLEGNMPEGAIRASVEVVNKDFGGIDMYRIINGVRVPVEAFNSLPKVAWNERLVIIVDNDDRPTTCGYIAILGSTWKGFNPPGHEPIAIVGPIQVSELPKHALGYEDGRWVNISKDYHPPVTFRVPK
ncbi:MAG: hypothetical protein WC802_02480 [Patescibacteria group bacterium]|jgi:hypothetical protein